MTYGLEGHRRCHRASPRATKSHGFTTFPSPSVTQRHPASPRVSHQHAIVVNLDKSRAQGRSSSWPAECIAHHIRSKRYDGEAGPIQRGRAERPAGRERERPCTHNAEDFFRAIVAHGSAQACCCGNAHSQWLAATLILDDAAWARSLAGSPSRRLRLAASRGIRLRP
jgi:hypothetical protein